MPDEQNFIPPGKMPAAAADELLRLLSQQTPRNGDDDILDNPELERLFGSLSFEEPESAQAPAVLTLDDLVLGTPAAPAADVACLDCEARNPAAARFCGMCGHELGKSSTAAKNRGNGGEEAVAVMAAPELPSPPEDAAEPVSKGHRVWKIAFLMLLCLVLSVVMYQQLDWQLPVWSTLRSLVETPAPLPKTSAAPAVITEQAAALPESEGRQASAPPSVNNKPAAPTKPVGTPAAAPVTAEPQMKAASEAAEPAAPPAATKPEPQDHAPSIAAPTSPIELPTIVRSPSSSPVLQASPFAGQATPAPKTSGGFVPAVPIFKVSPQAPSNVHHAEWLGAVVLHARIGTDGTVQDVSVVSGNLRLVNAAIEAVKKWRYRPFMLDGKPVEGETNITLNFKSE